MPILNNRASEYFQRKVKRLRMRSYRSLCSISPRSVCQLLLDRHLDAALRNGCTPAVPFALADAALGNDLIFPIVPASIERHLEKENQVNGRLTQASDWFVFPGSWKTAPVDQTSTYRAMTELLKAGEAYIGTSSYKLAADRLQRKGPHKHNGRWVYREIDLQKYFENYLSVSRSIKSEGFIPHRAAGTDDLWIGIALDGDGSLVHFRKGHHRLALARELRLGSIPAQILVIHHNWLRQHLTGRRPLHQDLVQQLKRHLERTKHVPP